MNHEKFTQTYMAMYKQLVFYINKRINDLHISEELANDIFLNYYKRGIDFDPNDSKTRNSLYKAAKNKIIDFMRKEKRRPQRVELFEEAVFDNETFLKLEKAVIKAEVVSTFHSALNSCKKDEREIFLRRNMLNETIYTIQKDYPYSRFKINKMLQNVNLKIREMLFGYYDDIFD